MDLDKIADNGAGFCVLFGYFFIMAISVFKLWSKALDKPMDQRFPTLFCALMLWFFGARVGGAIGEYMDMSEYVSVFTWAALIYLMVRYFQKMDENAAREESGSGTKRKD